MKGMPFNFQVEGGFNWNGVSFNGGKRKQQGEGSEPCSVLDNRRSPSPPTSTSTLSSSLGGGGGGGGGGSSDSAGVAAISDNNPTSATTAHKWQQQQQPAEVGNKKEADWASELQPIPPSSLEIGNDPKCGGLDEWEAVLSETAAGAAGSPGQEQTFLHWIMGDIDDSKQQQQQHQAFEPFGPLLDHPGFAPFEGPSLPMLPNQYGIKGPFLPPAPTNDIPMFFQQPVDEKPHHLFNQHHHLPPPQNPSFFLPVPPQAETHVVVPPNPKRHHSMMPSVPSQQHSAAAAFAAPCSNQQRPPAKPKEEAAAAAAAAIAQQQQAIVDQLLKVAELVDSGNPFSAREILARLNQQLPASSVGLKPLVRSAFIFKDVLSLLTDNPGPRPAPASNPWEVVLKLSSYKAFSEVSPLIHFANFSCTQTLLEEIGGSDRIHVLDFDIGVGSQWSSFMQELAHRRPQSMPLLKITAFVSPSAFHPLELHLTRDNLSHLAAELNIPFEFAFVSVDSFDPSEILAVSAPDEAIAVSLPVGSHYPQPFPTLLRLVKQLRPKIVVSVDQMCDRSDLPFSHHFLHSFQACMVLLDSIDAAGTNADVASKIERFLVQPRIENAVMGRRRAADKMPPWRALFASVGFVPSQFSNFTETQAECLLKRVQVRGFHVEKRQASLFLYWQRGELGSVSAWKC